jgi:hypothetical protein
MIFAMILPAHHPHADTQNCGWTEHIAASRYDGFDPYQFAGA